MNHTNYSREKPTLSLHSPQKRTGAMFLMWWYRLMVVKMATKAIGGTCCKSLAS